MLKPMMIASFVVGASLSTTPVLAETSLATATAVQSNTAMNSAVMRSLLACKRTSDNCRTAINHAWATLVFPVVKASNLGAGGAGARGALVEDGRITGYYTIAGGPAVPPPNIDGTTQVFVFDKDGPVARLKSGEDWAVGTTPDVRLITENTGDIPPSGQVEAFIFDRGGLHAGVSLRAFDVWKTGTPRPKPQI